MTDNPLREGPANPEYMKGYRDALSYLPVPEIFTQTYAEGYAFGVTTRTAEVVPQPMGTANGPFPNSRHVLHG